MGGDNAPAEIVAGALLAARDGIGSMILTGDEAKIRTLIGGDGGDLVEVVHAPQAIAMDATPSQALRGADDTSLGTAINMVRDGRADAVVSAGNSGAFLAIALIRLRTIAGIARPAIAVLFPGRDGPVVLLDAGANVDCRPEWMMQFGIMGSAYARAVLGVAEPRVGIISVGEERAKGDAQTIEASSLLDGAPIRFIGNIEGKDILVNVADVVVADGFVGNVMLKFAEGIGSWLSQVVRDEIGRSSMVEKIGAYLVRPALYRVAARGNYDTYGGAPLLGLRGTCIVAHGRATREAVRNAIRAAATAVREDVVARIEELVAEPSGAPASNAAP